MTQKKCIYCDTIYPTDTEHCPLCGGSAADLIDVSVDESSIPAPEPATAAPRRSKTAPAAPVSEEKEDEEPRVVPRWMTALIAVALAAALLVGLAFIGYSLGLFDGKDDPDEQVSLPLDDPQDSQQNTNQDSQNGQNEQNDANIGGDTNVTDDNEGTQPDGDTTGEEQPPVSDPDDNNGNPDDSQDNPVGDSDQGADEQDTPDDPTDPDEPQYPCTGISLNYTDVTVSFKGETFTIRATLNPSNCDEEVVWSSTDETYATVDENGKVTAVKGKGNGSIKIIATCGNETAECIVRLNFPEIDDSSTAESGDTGGYSLNLTDFTMGYNGEQVEVEVKNANLMTDTFVWTIDDPAVASIVTAKDTCIVTALTSGTTTLRVQINGTTELTCIVRCSKAVGDSAETG